MGERGRKTDTTIPDGAEGSARERATTCRSEICTKSVLIAAINLTH
jgi:hypothetical protein